MSDTVWLALIAALPATIVAIGGIVKVLREVRQVHVLVNGNKDALMAEIAALKESITAGAAREAALKESITAGAAREAKAKDKP